MPYAIITDTKGVIERTEHFKSTYTGKRPDESKLGAGEKLWWVQFKHQVPESSEEEWPGQYRLSGDEWEPVFTKTPHLRQASVIRAEALGELKRTYAARLQDGLGTDPAEAELWRMKVYEAMNYLGMYGEKARIAEPQLLASYQRTWMVAGVRIKDVPLESVAKRIYACEQMRMQWAARVDRAYTVAYRTIHGMTDPSEQRCQEIIQDIEWPDLALIRTAMERITVEPS